MYKYAETVLNDSDLVAPINNSGGPADLSHLEFCFNYNVNVTKTANTSFTRTYGWSVTKTADPTELTLSAGQKSEVDYVVDVERDAGEDSKWAVGGTVTLTNPWPAAASIVSVTDELSDGTKVALDCGGATSVPAKGTLQCTYSASVNSGAAGKNTATSVVKFNTKERTAVATADYVFRVPTNEIDECVVLSDSLYPEIKGALCETKKEEYTLQVGPFDTDTSVVNVATIVPNDSEDPKSDGATVKVTVPVAGCTLTQGYWKTHSKQGPAPYDDTWAKLASAENPVSLEEKTQFFQSGQTWLQVFNTPPRGNQYYNLAQQYMAAKLNVLNGASTPTEVSEAITAAEAIFSRATVTTLNKADVDSAKRLATLLDNYNNGLTGPGHCSE